MKNKIYTLIIAGCALIGSLTSCSDYLDVEYIFKNQMNMDTVFQQKDYAEQWLSNVYGYLADGQNVMIASKGHQPFNFLADDMYYGDRGNQYEFFKNCRYGEGDKQNWNVCYEGIRNASIFIHNIDQNREMTKEEIADNKAQARFLRANFYWLLLRKYGPIPILPDEGMDFTKEYEDLALPRNTYLECAEYIANEMALAAQDLEESRPAREIARATKGAALAFRARAYLYAASPLFNGNDDEWAQQLVDDQGNRLISKEYNEELWAKAAAAAKDVIDLNKYELYTAKFRANDEGPAYPKTIVPPTHPVYSEKNWPNGWKDIDPFESYRQIFNGAIAGNMNKEIVFTHGVNTNTEGVMAMIKHQMPASLNGWNTHGVTLKHVNTYYMNDGGNFYAYGKEDPREGRPTYDFTTKEEVDAELCRPLPAGVSKEYLGREPRFYASIAYNGSIWDVETSPITENRRNQQVFYWRGSQDGRLTSAPGFYLRTGLGIKKFVHPLDYFENRDAGTSKGPAKIDVDIRYAEILLIYAEALNELTGTYTIPTYDGTSKHTISRNTEEMSFAISQIRIRAGLPNFDSATYDSQTEFRKALKRERQIELFAETHRYFDLRRWKDAEKEETMPVWGCNMNATDSQKDMFHYPVLVSSLPNVFIPKMYLWPISYSELRKNRKLTQNPGWTTFD
ncbi:RagB/SusD family nutrient uptake outer membrane protein [Bacteroides sp. 224]|uniref:RagB/SusD family nutrient uptake outer membrane protein n=1 Tax=Bacteroides sp. 224 TaxID=2302936 RepID=UPI0013D1F941|nr:RagB/SusD family nutrient uptake outer membrane protein [Bacteroides sp. 224]NDV66586.1 RagB/SusD family nutrient uptake outer membrane protein [Bacteroides sp. 224]